MPRDRNRQHETEYQAFSNMKVQALMQKESHKANIARLNDVIRNGKKELTRTFNVYTGRRTGPLSDVELARATATIANLAVQIREL